MQAYRAATTVDSEREIRIRQVPFRPGATVEVIVLEPETPPLPLDARPKPAARELSPERKAALERTLRRSYHLGGQFPSRDEFHER